MKMRGMKKIFFLLPVRKKAASGPCGFFYAWYFSKKLFISISNCMYSSLVQIQS